jgi:multidrug resistance efflux pump
MNTIRTFILRRGPFVILPLAAIGVVWALGYSYYARSQADPYRSRMLGWPQPVRTAQVESKDVEKVIGATALTLASQIYPAALGSSQVLYPDSGPAAELRLKVVNVHEGDYVHKDDILFEIDPEPFKIFKDQRAAATKAALAQLEYVKKVIPLNLQIRSSNLKNAEAELRFRDKDKENWLKGVNIYDGLVRKGVESPVQLFTVSTTYLLAGYNYSLAMSNLEIAKKSVLIGDAKDEADLQAAQSAYETASLAEKQLQHDIDRLKIHSPIDGWVTFANKPELIVGGMVTKTDGTLCHVVKLDPLFVRMDFPQERIDEISLGMRGRVVLDAWPQESFEGKVVRMSPAVNPQTRTMPVTIELANTNGRIRSGISGFARLYVKEKTTEIPAAAVFQSKNKAMVLEVVDNKAVAREVRTSALAELGMLELKEGLRPGAEVIVFNGFYHDMGKLNSKLAFVQDGDVVAADWRKWTRRE